MANLDNMGLFSTGARRTGNLLLLILVAVILLEAVIAVTSHRSNAEWLRLSKQGTAEERIAALQVLTNRAADFKIDKSLVRELLSSPEPRLREFAFFPAVTRFQVRLQREHLEAVPESPVRLRQDFFLHYRPGPSRTMKLNDLRRYLDSLEQAPSDPAQDHEN